MRCNVKRCFTSIAISACIALCGCGGAVKSPDIQPHLILSPDVTYRAPVEDRAEKALPSFAGTLTAEQYRARVDMLYDIVVYDKAKPVFVEDDPVYPIYVAARNVLYSYMVQAWNTESGGEANIAHAIHDYLVCAIDYDFELYAAYRNGNNEVAGHPAFYIDGVFLNKVAVCDGLSRAFNFLCAMSGLDSVRVTGTFSASTHAWNKVRIDGKWYNIDITADTANYTVGSERAKQLSHGYFLLSDKTISEFVPGGHIFTPQYVFEADRDYDIYSASDMTITVGGKTYSSVVRSQSELNELFSAISKQKGNIGKIELKLDFYGKTQVNGADMYISEIKEAYGKLDDASFAFSNTNKPYFRYPNGVYLFLMYK